MNLILLVILQLQKNNNIKEVFKNLMFNSIIIP